jgi:hypothetical protein
LLFHAYLCLASFASCASAMPAWRCTSPQHSQLSSFNKF